MNLAIVLLDGQKLNFKINKESCTIGRSPQCDVVIPHEAMSRKHCLLEIKNGDLYVTDLGSSNGVTIEGEKIPANTPILYQTFLTLSFGAIHSIAIELEEAKVLAPINENSSPSIPTRKVEKKTPPSKVAASAPPKDEPKTKQIKIAIIVLALLALVYFMTKEDASNQPTPEQIYE